MKTSQSNQKGKRDELNHFKSYFYLTQAICAQIFAKQYLLFQKSNFTMKRASFDIAILSFFLGLI